MGLLSKLFRTWGPPKRLALRWPAFDKRCSSCYTLRGCGFADIQSREEFKDALARNVRNLLYSCKLELVLLDERLASPKTIR